MNHACLKAQTLFSFILLMAKKASFIWFGVIKKNIVGRNKKIVKALYIEQLHKDSIIKFE